MNLKIKNDFQKNFLKLFSGTIIGQLIPILATPLLARIYSPEDIGIFALYFSVISIGTGIICMKTDQVIVLPEKDNEAWRIYKIALKISKYLSFFCFCIFIIAKGFSLLELLNDIPNWWGLIGLHFFINGIFQANTFLLNRFKFFGAIGKSKIIKGVVFTLLQLALYEFNEYGLISGALIASLVTVFFMESEISKYLAKPKKNQRSINIGFNHIERNLLVKHKNFPIYTTSNALLNSTSNNLPMLLLGELFSFRITGLYSWANRIIQTPMSFILSSLQQVFYQEVASRVSQNKSIYKLVLNTYKKLFLFGLLPYGVMMIFAPHIFSFVFGEEWREAGTFTQLLIPWFFIMFLNSPITSIILVLNKQKKYLFFEIILFFGRLLALVLGYFIFQEAFYSILLYSIVGLGFNLFLTFYLLNLAKNG